MYIFSINFSLFFFPPYRAKSRIPTKNNGFEAPRQSSYRYDCSFTLRCTGFAITRIQLASRKDQRRSFQSSPWSEVYFLGRESGHPRCSSRRHRPLCLRGEQHYGRRSSSRAPDVDLWVPRFQKFRWFIFHQMYIIWYDREYLCKFHTEVQYAACKEYFNIPVFLLNMYRIRIWV